MIARASSRFVIALLAVISALAHRSEAQPAPMNAAAACCPIVELRQYTLLPGKRDFLIDLFEKHFIESQEVTGITVIGQFRVIGDPNRFFWLQGFQNMPERKAAFEKFYGGPAWKKYRGIANSAFLDTNNVLLLHPAHADSGFTMPVLPRPPIGAKRKSRGIAVATTYYLGSMSQRQFDRFFERSIRPVVQAAGASVIATLSTDDSANTFPKLPVRTGVNAFIWMACFASVQAYQRYGASLERDPRWEDIRDDFAVDQMFVAPEVLLLQPTPRSSIQC